MSLALSNSTMAIMIWTMKHTYHVQDVTFYNTNIQTTVTKSSAVVDAWISDIVRVHQHRLHKLIIGLDIEWLPTFVPGTRNRVATLQLCIGRRCLIFQLLYCDGIPTSLVNFLGNSNFMFVGVGIEGDAMKLLEDYGLIVGRSMDLRILSMLKLQQEDYGRMGLKRLGIEILGKLMEKPLHISVSKWDAQFLTEEQIKYACIDAFVSFAIAIELLGSEALFLV
ncbi:3'-5' exonuclease domain [Dillenia turbinata]|uniref:3'-5' exonuclease domain n=1 Tax=Dillenia turbinata TaxID=194707 RepID=A0AAN8ZKE1_9MAGN